MSTPEQPDTPPLTRKQLRDLRNTGATPVIPTDAPADDPSHGASTEAPAPVPAAPLARAAEPVVVAAPPAADATVDLGVSPLTRRQARQQERIRTASVPVITPEVAAAHAAAVGAVSATSSDEQDAPETEPATPTAAMRDLFGISAGASRADSPPADSAGAAEAQEPSTDAHDAEPSITTIEDARAQEPEAFVPDFGDDADGDQEEGVAAEDDAVDDGPERALVNPKFGSAAVVEEAASLDLPTSFDQLLARGATGSHGTSNALIMTPSTGGSAIVAPITATGEVLITGTLNLPEGLGSTGHAPGTADGKEIDAVLIDGELPAHSSPTPIAASAAISTVKSNGDVIKPPAPEKGSKLMMTLAITAGVLALALVGVLILAFVTGVL